MKKTLGISLLLIGTVVGLAACSSNKESNTESKNKEVTQEINVSSGGELSTLDSAFYSDVYSSDMIGQTAEGLYRLNKKQEPELAMAEKDPEVSQDGLKYTFKIKPDAKWSNGDTVKAVDFVYSFKTVVDPAYGSSSSNQMDIFKNARSIREGKADLDTFGVKAIDEKTLELELEYPVPYLADLLVGTPFMPKNEKFATEKGKAYGTNADNFVGNGPFTIEGWKGTNDTWVLKKNKDYWDAENVKLEKINVQVIKEMATGIQLFEAGDLDYTVIADSYALEYKDSPEANFVPKAMLGYLSPNQKREVTGNVNVRKAFSLAIDKKQFAENILGDGSIPLNGFIPTNFSKSPDKGEDFRKQNGDLVKYNVKEAKKYWETAKKELGKDKIELELISADSGSAKKTIEFVQGQLQENLPGLTIKLKSMPLQNRLDLQQQGQFDLMFGTWTPDYADPVNFLEFYDSKGGLNTAKYNNPEYDKGLVDVKVNLANDKNARWDKMLDLEKILIKEDAGVIPVYQGAIGYLKSDRLDGLQIYPFGRTISYRLASVK
ncbi:peptide ABC transporter substrate-binding protein [Vagococcus silagei]|uniref:Peptide ABC transporter substrate-binding protein n=1 Tax=Vagococcus silagei TaxID=2508885 RepID=A0A4S3B6E8_9ENTE|nr:peptide ABC transporter substrate-binding protein [Vagococcus silagei]THB61480.1 peptide ABC transporter substrate-binding protein [Vagococcus silagei]